MANSVSRKQEVPKMKYEQPIFEVIELEVKDVICASSLENGGKGDGGWIEQSEQREKKKK